MRDNTLRERLRDELRVAMKQRDKAAVAALRSALSVIDNADVPRSQYYVHSLLASRASTKRA